MTEADRTSFVSLWNTHRAFLNGYTVSLINEWLACSMTRVDLIEITKKNFNESRADANNKTQVLDRIYWKNLLIVSLESSLPGVHGAKERHTHTNTYTRARARAWRRVWVRAFWILKCDNMEKETANSKQKYILFRLDSIALLTNPKVISLP